MARRVEKDVLVGLDDADALGVDEVFGDPVGGDEDLGVGVVGHEAGPARGESGPEGTGGRSALPAHSSARTALGLASPEDGRGTSSRVRYGFSPGLGPRGSYSATHLD